MGKSKTPKGKGPKRPKGTNGRVETIRIGDSDLRIDILTLEEAAEFLAVPADKLRDDAESHRVPGRLVGGEWRFTKQALYHWLTKPHPFRASDIGPPEGMERIVKAMPGRRKLADLPMPDITEEEYAAFRASLDAQRDEVDRLTKSGKYAEDE
jgi:excisionase family DNA binding protein